MCGTGLSNRMGTSTEKEFQTVGKMQDKLEPVVIPLRCGGEVRDKVVNSKWYIHKVETKRPLLASENMFCNVHSPSE